MGGFAPIRLKKLNGAALTFPSGLTVVTNAIGRGVTKLAKIGYARSANSPSKSSSMTGRMLLPWQESQRVRVVETRFSLWERTLSSIFS
jgi:hypothetical protein